MSRPILSRRTFLALAGAFCLASPFATSRGPIARWFRPATRRAEWRHALADVEGAHVIGEAYLDAVPEEADVTLMLELLEASLGVQADSPPRAALRARLQDRIRHDFERDETIQLDGWILARTEARLCALAALL
jgi:hypothetical protein